jgi:hypothetical protein
MSAMFAKGWCDDRDVRPLVRGLISDCFSLADLVAVVINSDSPEGHLPMDFFQHCPDRNVTSQMLLVSFLGVVGSATSCASPPPRLSIFPIILFLSTTLLTGMTNISLHVQWPLTSQLHGMLIGILP